MIPLNIKEINKLYSPTWVACNDNSKSKSIRESFLTKHGGEFIKNGKYFKWQEIPIPPEIYIPRRLLKFINAGGKIVEIDHMSDFCIQNNLSRAAMYEVLRGQRRSHKGYRALIIPEE